MDFLDKHLKCRTCLAKISPFDCISLFVKNEHFKSLSYAELIMECTTIQIAENDFLPQQICNRCKEQIQNSYEFKKLCEKSEEVLRSELKNCLYFKKELCKIEDIKNLGVSLVEIGIEVKRKSSKKISKNFDKITFRSFCHVCKVDLKNKHILQKHVLNNHPGEVTCSNCNKLFPNYRKLNKHSYLHFYENTHDCPHCDLKFARPYKVKNHIMRVHQQKEDDNKQKNELTHTKKVQRRTICYACNIDQICLLNYRKHVKIEHPGEVTCLECGKPCENYKRLLKHRFDIHLKKILKCPHCERTFKNRTIFNIHLANIHRKNDPKLEKYRILHLCPTCGQNFSSKFSLTSHIRIHTGEKPYKCSLCEKSFTQWSTFKRHNTIHSQEKKFVCEMCEKKFRHNYDLYRHHKRVHQNMNNVSYQCKQCNNTYKDKKDLKGHIDSVHLGIKHKCDECGKEFSYKNGLRVHKKSHM